MSESEFERLYQEFVRKGGGKYTFDGSDVTPAEYYNLQSLTELSADEKARLAAAQEQYNKQFALNTISTELATGNFTNPLTPMIESGRNAVCYRMASDGGITLMSQLNVAIRTNVEILAYFNSIGLNPFFLQTADIPLRACPLYDDLQNHTNSQVANLPQTIEDVNSLVNMSKMFGEQDNTCNKFNALMGLLSGSFDGMIKYLEDIVKPITELIGQFIGPLTQILGIVAGGAAGAVYAISQILAPILDPFLAAMNDVAGMVGKAIGFISDLTNQVANEIAGMLGLASSLAAMAQAISIASSSFDVCQMAVLMRTASPNMVSALQLFSTPLPSPSPTVSTSVDPRADPTTVKNAVTQARQNTATAPGVPQSPLTANAILYEPISAYFTAPLSKLLSPITDVFSTIRSSTGQVSVTKNLTNGFTESGSTGGISSSDSAIVDTKAKVVKSRAFTTYSSTHMSNLLRAKTDLKNLRIEIVNEMNSGTSSFSVATIAQSKTITESLSNSENSITFALDAHTRNLTYKTVGGKRDENIETHMTQEYTTVINPSVESLLSASSRVLASSKSWWNSVKN